MSESHAADSPMDEERARRETEERREKIKKGIDLVSLLEKSSLLEKRQRRLAKVLSSEEIDSLLWYIDQLRSVCRTADRVLDNQAYEMQQLKKKVTEIY